MGSGVGSGETVSEGEGSGAGSDGFGVIAGVGVTTGSLAVGLGCAADWGSTGGVVHAASNRHRFRQHKIVRNFRVTVFMAEHSFCFSTGVLYLIMRKDVPSMTKR